MNGIQEKLSAPFNTHELKFFPTALTKDKTKAKVAAYIDARAVMDRLDEAVGSENWGTGYTVLDMTMKAVECRLSVKLGDTWIIKCDVGYPNEGRDADNADKEPLKAAFSDALKRAAVQFGIGRYIYSLELEQDWLPVDEYGKFKQQPRIKGSPQQAPVCASSGAGSEPKAGPGVMPAAAPPDKKPSFWEWAASMKFDRKLVEDESDRLFGTRDPATLSADDKRRLSVALTERKVTAN